MTCKNCSHILYEHHLFCNQCGGKVVRKRITVKTLLTDFFTNVFGWDNKFFVTTRMLLLKPHILFEEYIGGARKKYMKPMAMLVLCAAFSLFCFNFFADDYIALNINTNAKTGEIMAGMMKDKLGDDFDVETFKKEQLAFIAKSTSFTLKYFNLLVVFMLPLYAFIAFLTYRKPYNYGEHLVVNCYIQSFTFLFTSLVFVLSVFTNPGLYALSMLFVIFYYTYAYGKLYKLSFAGAILKLLIFCGILVAGALLLGVFGFLFGVLIRILNS